MAQDDTTITFSAYLSGGIPDDVPRWREPPKPATERTDDRQSNQGREPDAEE